MEASEIREHLSRVLYDFFREEQSPEEQRSWEGTVIYLQKLLKNALPDDMGVALEYCIPGKDLRADCVLTGKDCQGKLHAVIIEMKGWGEAEKRMTPGMVRTFLVDRRQEVFHPSNQVGWYADLLESNQTVVWREEVGVHPCALLYNCVSKDVINDDAYSEYTSKAPAFCKGDEKEFLGFVRRFIHTGDGGEALRLIDGSRREISNKLSDAITTMIDDRDFFPLSTQQRTALESIARAVEYQEENGGKLVLAVLGGPGTGKSVIAIRALCKLLKRSRDKELNQQIRYLTKTRPPRAMINNTLKDAGADSLAEFISYPGYGVLNGGVHVSLVDEAHRLDGRRADQVDLIVENSDISIFFIDPRQMVSVADIGSLDHIRAIARKHHTLFREPPYPLTVDFRVSITSSIENLLQYPGSANVPLPPQEEYDFRVFDDPMEMHRELMAHDNRVEKNRVEKARMVAGYTRKWVSRLGADKMDWVLEEMPEFRFKWNMDEANEDINWATRQGLDRIGCIHSCQGMEFDYIGVIISRDITVSEGGVLEFHPEMHSSDDPALMNYCKPLTSMTEQDAARITEILRNTYFVLLTRGIKGCYVYVEGNRNDPAVKRMTDYLKAFESNRRKALASEEL